MGRRWRPLGSFIAHPAAKPLRNLVTLPQFDRISGGASPASKPKRWPRRILLAAFVCLLAWPLLAWAAAQLLIVSSNPDSLSSADAVVVFSGSSTYIERASWAAKLYREGRAPLIVLTDDKLISGWNAREGRNPFFYELAAEELEKGGVPAGRIQVITEAALGTYYESLNVCEYAATNKFKKILVVTSAYHSRRAQWSMRKACSHAQIETVVSAPSPGWQTPSPWTWWLRRWGWRVVAGEYAKLVYYWWLY